MRRWILINDCSTNGNTVDMYDLEAESKEEALNAAREEYKSLTPDQKNQIDNFFFCSVEVDEDGEPDFDTMTDEYYFPEISI